MSDGQPGPRAQPAVAPHAAWSAAPSVALLHARDLLGEAPELRAALIAQEPALASWLDLMANGGGQLRLPRPQTIAAFAAEPFFRPPGSHRSFYYGAGPSSAVIALKGLEPCASDFDALLFELERACYSPHSMAEHLVFEEHKLPGCVTVHEASREAERALAIQRAHLRVYGSLARMPVPLFVAQHEPGVVDEVAGALRRSLSAAAFEMVEPLLHAGLAVYVYYYPTTPVRVRELDTLLQGHDFRHRTWALLQTVGDPEQVLQRWAEAFARMLHLGFLPASLASLRTGNCCQPQNACIDGGFVDLDSLTELSELRSDTALYAGLQHSTDSLLRTVRAFVAGSSDPARDEDVGNRVDLHYLAQAVTALIQRALVTEARPSVQLDPRIARYYAPPSSFAELVDRLGSYYSPRSELEVAARDYTPFGLARIAAIKRS